ncbi:hypothetical protein [Lysobacter sp. cf310]|uniref:hypothetical protein n=1 Tax=Lysobacter sp. cf310 TaxID=1761790 RepID=UPI0008EA77C4|nr:hypothetical protein [Lysobacter sp. cf310]SFL14246.1 hypothetical protein SAMN04487938_3435 [Lysobacter sp. cf310]
MVRQIQTSVAAERFVILHYHIFKNAGSTIDYALHRNFGEGLVAFHGGYDDAVLVADDVSGLVNSDLSIRAITSHHLRYPKPVVRGVRFIDVCFIRHPLDRIRSLYHYGLKLEPTTWLGGVAQSFDEQGFVAHLVMHAPHVINDVQVNLLASGGFYARPPGAADLEDAYAIVERACALGVVDMFDISMVSIEHHLRPMFPTLSMEYVPQNVSSPQASEHEEGGDGLAAACRQVWGDALYAQVVALNEHDLRLYAKAREEVSRRFALVPDSQERLIEFGERRIALAEALKPPPPSPDPAAPGLDSAELSPDQAEPSLDPMEPSLDPAQPSSDLAELSPGPVEPSLDPVEQSPDPAQPDAESRSEGFEGSTESAERQ